MFLLHVSIPITYLDIYKAIIIIMEAYTNTYMKSRFCQIYAYVELNYNIVN
jgi:hypothetical protein